MIEFVFGYLFVVFVLSRFFVPHIGFERDVLPSVPVEISSVIGSLKSKCPDRESFARASYDLLSSRFMSSSALMFYRFDVLFSRDVSKVWNSRVLPCNQLNFLYRLFLVESGLFSESDIRVRYTPVFGMLHQYLQVFVGKWVDVDVWFGGFGSRAGFFSGRLFRQKLFKPRV